MLTGVTIRGLRRPHGPRHRLIDNNTPWERLPGAQGLRVRQAGHPVRLDAFTCHRRADGGPPPRGGTLPLLASLLFHSWPLVTVTVRVTLEALLLATNVQSLVTLVALPPAIAKVEPKANAFTLGGLWDAVASIEARGHLD